MKKVCLAIVAVCMIAALAGCSQASNVSLGDPKMTVYSESVDGSGMLATLTAAAKRNDPAGANQSPQLAWDEVDGAACYAVMMYDLDADWLHWSVTDLETTSLEQGAYTDESVYVGPYPPEGVGKHEYQMVVFALKEKLGEAVGNVDKKNDYRTLISQLDGGNGNILAYGHTSGFYEYGKNIVIG